jgi:hypothetical protein
MQRKYLFFLIFIWTSAYSQIRTTAQDSSFDNKMDEYLLLVKTADIYEAKTEREFQKINLLKMQAHLYIDSAKVISMKVKNDKSKASIYNQKINILMVFTTSSISKLDSILKVANAYKDSALIKNKEAEAFCLKINRKEEKIKHPVILNYVVQLGAGNLDLSYFNKVKDIKKEIISVLCNDGIKRYVVGIFNTPEEAIVCKDKLKQVGYKDAIIRTMESLYK